MKDGITIEYINRNYPEVLEALNKLMPQLDADIPKHTEEFINKIIKSSLTRIYVARNSDGTIVATATLVIYQVLSCKRAVIEDVVVDKEYRRRGIGRKLLEKVILEATKENVTFIDLTSRPARAEANNFYLSLGFKKRDTNVYRYTNSENGGTK